jgi:hypothetical protein
MINKELIAFKNLALWTVEGADSLTERYATLEEAMDKHMVALHETGNVGELLIDNLSDYYVFIMAGDIVKGGRQDRTMAEDVILKPASKNVPLKSFCVEQSRWHKRGYESDREFSSSKKMLSDRRMKFAARMSRSQSAVWDEVSNYQSVACCMLGDDVRSSASPSSLELTLDNEKLRAAIKEYIDVLKPAIEQRSNVLGFVFGINGRISTMDAFGSAELFGKLRDKLLESAASEACMQADEHLKFEHPAAEAVEDFLDAASQGRLTTRTTGEITLEKRYETTDSLLFETYHAEAGREEKVHSSAYNRQESRTHYSRGAISRPEPPQSPNGEPEYHHGGFQQNMFRSRNEDCNVF